VCVCICSLSYPAYNAPYCHLWPAPLYSVPPHFIKARFSGGGDIEYKMCVLISSKRFVWNFSHSKKNWARYDKKKSSGLQVKYSLFWSDLMKLEFSLQVFRKILKYRISWKSAQWEPSCSMQADGRTEERTDVTQLIVAFRNFANAPKKCHAMRHCNGNLESVRNTQATKYTILLLRYLWYITLNINSTLNIQCDINIYATILCVLLVEFCEMVIDNSRNEQCRSNLEVTRLVWDVSTAMFPCIGGLLVPKPPTFSNTLKTSHT